MNQISVDDALARGRSDIMFPAIVASYFTLIVVILIMAFAPVSFFAAYHFHPLCSLFPLSFIAGT